MPFTFSHPALVLPFRYFPSRWVSMTGLLIGSMAPDFEKFMRMQLTNAHSHTWLSIIWFSLPLSLIAAFIFHLLVRNTLISNLPLFLKKRVHRFVTFDWLTYFSKNYLVVVSSILIGAASHLFWDGFTHRQTQLIDLLPFFSAKVAVAGRQISFYHFLNAGSSAVGMLVVLYAIYKLPSSPMPPRAAKTSAAATILYWSMIGFITCAILALRISAFHWNWLVDIGISLISAVLVALLVVSSALQLQLWHLSSK